MGNPAYDQYLKELREAPHGYYTPGLYNPGLTEREFNYFDVPGLAAQSPYGSPAEVTQYAGGGPRSSAYFGPSGIQYETLDKGTRDIHRILDQTNLQRLYTDQSYDRFRGALGEQLGEVDRGFAEAFGYADKQGGLARRRTLDRETQLASEISARSGGRGYAEDYMRRGLAADTSLQLAQIDEGIARMYSDLALGRTGARTNVLGSLAQSYLGQADDFFNLYQSEQALLQGHPALMQKQRDYSGLYNLIGAGLGAAGTYFGLKSLGGGSAQGGGFSNTGPTGAAF